MLQQNSGSVLPRSLPHPLIPSLLHHLLSSSHTLNSSPLNSLIPSSPHPSLMQPAASPLTPHPLPSHSSSSQVHIPTFTSVSLISHPHTLSLTLSPSHPLPHITPSHPLPHIIPSPFTSLCLFDPLTSFPCTLPLLHTSTLPFSSLQQRKRSSLQNWKPQKPNSPLWNRRSFAYRRYIWTPSPALATCCSVDCLAP